MAGFYIFVGLLGCTVLSVIRFAILDGRKEDAFKAAGIDVGEVEVVVSFAGNVSDYKRTIVGRYVGWHSGEGIIDDATWMARNFVEDTDPIEIAPNRLIPRSRVVCYDIGKRKPHLYSKQEQEGACRDLRDDIQDH